MWDLQNLQVVKYLLLFAPLMASATSNDTTTTTTAAPKVTKRFDLTCDVAMTCSEEERYCLYYLLKDVMYYLFECKSVAIQIAEINIIVLNSITSV